jgi:sugar/nucleoside kinase (ribokinase family)
VIIVVGQPFARPIPSGWLADGPAVRTAAAVVEAGGRVELLGRIGDDPAGDAVVLDCARRGIGHAALIRSAGRPTPVLDGPGTSSRPLGLDAGDVELGLRYFVDLDGVAVVDPLPSSALAVAAAVVAAHDVPLVVVVERGASAPALGTLRPGPIVLEAPRPEGRPAFDRLVGRLCAYLAEGMGPEEAFREAVAATGWTPTARSAGSPGTAAGR